MLNPKMDKDTGPKFHKPDLFHAAANDDEEELRAALEAGQSLDTQSRMLNDMTPIHYACYLKKVQFLTAAMREAFNPWILDINGRRAIDYARSNCLDEIQNQLFQQMYPRGVQDNVVEIS